MTSLIKSNQQKLMEVAKENGVNYLALYGSHARGDDTADSDIDLLVSFDGPKSLFNLIDLEEKLSSILNKKVDLVTRNGLGKYVKPYIQDDLQVIYEKNPTYRF